jgi:hypothetical protein
MMGNKKLSTIRQELKAVLAATGDDPIQWLEKRIAAATRQGKATEVLESVKNVLERSEPPKPRNRKVAAKKSSRT